MSKESKAIGYGNRYAERDLQIVSKDAYLHGWNEALRSQWVGVEEKLPVEGEIVLVLTSNGKVSTSKRYQPKDCKGRNVGLVTWKGSSTFVNSIIAWMPIPSFDDIIEDNKDVLQRLKDK